jgi:hypothetical protein
MAGDTSAVDRITEEVLAAQPIRPLRWTVQIDLNRALAAAHKGDFSTAFALAVPTAERTPKMQQTQTMRQLIGELCSAIPKDFYRDEKDHLRRLVTTG